MEMPERMFAEGHEPVGLRVTSYGSTSGINLILEALTPAEREIIQDGVFGKFLSLVEKPSFSGRFVRFLMSRMLKVQKKHEIWFLFAGKPVRFSLREFAIVTGLPCGKFPARSRRNLKNNIAETPYWPSLFGKLDNVSVETVIKMLKRRTVTDTEHRVKIAYLALLASVLLPTTHGHKIVKEHAELMKDMRVFLAFPWGRLAFEMIITSVKERTEITLSQNTIAVKGFVHAIQLVLVAAVPSILEVVSTSPSSESESEEDRAADGFVDRKRCLRSSHARKLNANPETIVDSIITDDGDVEIVEEELVWSDDDDDDKVDNMMNLINTEHSFSGEMFLGGSTKADVVRLIKEAQVKNDGKEKTRKGKKAKVAVSVECMGTCNSADVSICEPQVVADMVFSKVIVPLQKLEGVVYETNCKIEAMVRRVVAEEVNKMQKKVIDAVTSFVDTSTQVSPTNTGICERTTDNHVVGDIGQVAPPPIVCENQEKDVATGGVAVGNGGNSSEVGDNQLLDDHTTSHGTEEEPTGDVDGIEVNGNELGREDSVLRYSKRQKILHGPLITASKCGKEMLQRAREGCLFANGKGESEDYMVKYSKLSEKLMAVSNLFIGGICITSKDFADITNRTKNLQPKIVDLIVHQIRCFLEREGSELLKKLDIFDTKFVTLLVRNYTNFAKMADKESHVFAAGVLKMFGNEVGNITEMERFYFPFNFDKIHWVGLCVDCIASTIYVLDCAHILRKDSAVVKDLAPVALLFPYLLKQLGRLHIGKDPKPFDIVRPKSIPQNGRAVDSGITSMLLMEAHAIGGVEVCRCITSDVLPLETQRLAVMLYEENYGPL